MGLEEAAFKDSTQYQWRDYSTTKADDKMFSLESGSGELMKLELTTRRLLEGKAATHLYTRQIFNNTIDSWAKISFKLATTKFDNTMYQQPSSYGKNVCPVYAAGRASALLEFMERSSGIGGADESSSSSIMLNKSLTPNSVSFNSTLHAWAKCGDARQTEQIFLRMQKVGKGGAKPDIISYNTLLDAFAKQSARATKATDSINSAKCAEEWLRKMEQACANNDDGAVRPNTCSYNSVIDAWANSDSTQSATKAQDILTHMVRLYKSAGDANVKPDVITLNSVINAWSKSKVVDSAQRAESVLVFIDRVYGNGNEAVRPNATTFAAILNAWSKSSNNDAAYRAEMILKRMETLYNDGNNEVKPNVFAFTSVIDTFANNAKRDNHAASKAESILEWMLNISRDGQQKELSPNTVTFNAVIKAHAKSKQEGSAQRASNLLERMMQYEADGCGHMAPDTISFNAVINAWVNSFDNNGLRKAQQTLKLMEDLFAAGNGRFQPDTISYNGVLHGFSKCRDKDSADNAKALLNLMEKLHQCGNNRVCPNARSFTSVINAYAKSSQPDQAMKARELLQRMNSLSMDGGGRIITDIFAYTAVLNACAYTRGDNDAKAAALDIAISTMKEIQESTIVSANHISYAMILRACSRLCADKYNRNKLLEKYFDDCCRDGCVNEFVLRELPNNLRVKRNLRNLPPSWTRTFRAKRGNPT